jgi:hypothetical protein
VANGRLIELVAGDADRSPDDDTTTRDDRYVGRSATDVDDQASLRGCSIGNPAPIAAARGLARPRSASRSPRGACPSPGSSTRGADDTRDRRRVDLVPDRRRVRRRLVRRSLVGGRAVARGRGFIGVVELVLVALEVFVVRVVVCIVLLPSELWCAERNVRSETP